MGGTRLESGVRIRGGTRGVVVEMRLDIAG